MANFGILGALTIASMIWLGYIFSYLNLYPKIRGKEPRIDWVLDIKQALIVCLTSIGIMTPLSSSHPVATALLIVIGAITYYNYKSIFFLTRENNPYFAPLKKVLYFLLFACRGLSVLVYAEVFFIYNRKHVNCESLEQFLQFPEAFILGSFFLVQYFIITGVVLLTALGYLRDPAHSKLMKSFKGRQFPEKIRCSLLKIRSLFLLSHLGFSCVLLYRPYDSSTQIIWVSLFIIIITIDICITAANLRRLKTARGPANAS